MKVRKSSDPVGAKLRPATADGRATYSRHDSPDAVAEVLMPLEATAKAILVKANGLPAYWKATGLGPQRNKS